MATDLRFLTEEGIAQFEQYIELLHVDPFCPKPMFLLTAAEVSGELPEKYCVDERLFPNKLAMTRYVSKSFSEAVNERNPAARGVWTWLSLFWLDQLIPPHPTTGERKPNRGWYYIPSLSHRAEYRHLLSGPYKSFRSYGDNARLLLLHPLSRWSDIEEQTAGKREFLRMPGALAAADLLYFDSKKNKPKTGITNRNKPGTIRRLNGLIKQFARTYDIHSMTGKQVVSLLPPEFDAFRV